MRPHAPFRCELQGYVNLDKKKQKRSYTKGEPSKISYFLCIGPVYVSALRLTQSISYPITLTLAVSKCLDWSGLAYMMRDAEVSNLLAPAQSIN